MKQLAVRLQVRETARAVQNAGRRACTTLDGSIRQKESGKLQKLRRLLGSAVFKRLVASCLQTIIPNRSGSCQAGVHNRRPPLQPVMVITVK